MISALEKLSQTKRADYEPALPEIGAVLALVEVERIARENRSIARQGERVVRWQCPDCKMTAIGFPARNSDLDRRCYKKFWSEAQEQMLECGALMNVIFDEDSEGSSGQMEKFEMPWAEKVRQ